MLQYNCYSCENKTHLANKSNNNQLTGLVQFPLVHQAEIQEDKG